MTVLFLHLFWEAVTVIQLWQKYGRKESIARYLDILAHCIIYS